MHVLGPYFVARRTCSRARRAGLPMPFSYMYIMRLGLLTAQSLCLIWNKSQPCINQLRQHCQVQVLQVAVRTSKPLRPHSCMSYSVQLGFDRFHNTKLNWLSFTNKGEFKR